MTPIKVLSSAVLIFLSCGALRAEVPEIFQTPVTTEILDNEAFAEWVGGKETLLGTPPDQNSSDPVSPTLGLGTQTTGPGMQGLAFGESAQLGLRHLRIGFIEEIPVESLLVGGNVRVSVLKSDASYPGNMDDESQWVAATRLENNIPTSAEPASRDGVSLWVLPPGTSTRALRFSHKGDPVTSFSGHLNGAWVLSGRFSDVGSQAQALASAFNDNAGLMNNGFTNFYKVWANLNDNTDRLQVVADSPEWIMLLWPKPVTLRGLALVFPGFDSAEIQAYQGDLKTHPREAEAKAWKTLQSVSAIENQFPRLLGVSWIDFGQEVTTRAIRLRLTSASKLNLHTHIEGATRNGKRVWLGEWLALQSLPKADLASVVLPADKASADVAPPIPVEFTLPEDGFVTLVVENEAGQRVRNLVSETPFPKGKLSVGWDGTDDLGRDTDAASHGLYQIPAQFVVPGKYTVRGLWHKPIVPRYEFTVYNEGNPPWSTPDHLGGWLGNHSPPSAAVFVPPGQSPTGQPAVLLGSFVTEGPDGMAWVDLDGKKQGGKKWIGGVWTAAPYMARDAGEDADKEIFAYVASTWGGSTPDTAELRLNGLTKGEDREVGKFDLGKVNFEAWKAIAGVAVHNGIAAVTLAEFDELLFVDTRTKQLLARHPMKSARGLAYDAQGNLFVLTGTKLVTFGKVTDPTKLPVPRETISEGLEDPRALTFDAQGNILVSDRGHSNQVKVFSPAGKFVRAIGKANIVAAGPYDPLRMTNPSGLTVDSLNQLWVAEDDSLPKRVSVWTLDGKLVRATYGPSKYAGGGSLDPKDKTLFYYADEKGTMQFKLDWEKGTSRLTGILYRPGAETLALARFYGPPETAIYHGGKRYFTNCFNYNPTNGPSEAAIFIERDGVIHPAAAMGDVAWCPLLKDDAFKPLWPEGVDLRSTVPQDIEGNPVTYIWSDKNDDGKAQPDEVTFHRGKLSGVSVMNDLSFAVAKLDGKAMLFPTSGFSASGVPQYDFAKNRIFAEGVFDSGSTGGTQILAQEDGRAIITLGVAPFHQFSVSGVQNGKAWWSYPTLWPGLHASHSAPEPDCPGQLIGTTRLLGGFFTAKGSEGGPLWALNSNHGMIYIFTDDGMFVSTLFKDMRQGPHWSVPALPRGTDVGAFTLGDENFWPSITTSSDGNVYLVDGNRVSLVRIDGLDTIRRLPNSEVQVTEKDLQAAQQYVIQAEQKKQASKGRGILEAALRKAPPVIDGKGEDWSQAAWVDIDRRGASAYFNADSKPYNVTGAVAVAGDRLYAFWRTGNAKLLENTGSMPVAPFKTGGALDLMMGAAPAADENRFAPVSGDSRLLVTMVKGKPLALLYRAVVAGTKVGDKVPFSSPWRTITFDRVDDVSSKIEFAESDGNYEISIPLAELGLKPQPGLALRGDIGILRGNGTETTARVYWSNKATGILADVPSEAALTPNLWGRLLFVPQP